MATVEASKAPVIEESAGSLDEILGAVVLASLTALACLIAGFGLLSAFLSHTETLEASEWLLGFVLGIPIALVVADRLLADRVIRSLLTRAAPLAILASGATVFFARHAGTTTGRPAALPWSLLIFLVPPVFVAIRYGRRLLDAMPIATASRTDPWHWQAAFAVLLGGFLGISAFLPKDSSGYGPLLLSVGLVACLLVANDLFRGAYHDRRVAIALGIIVPLILALVVFDLSWAPVPDHQDFYLGPANDIHHGRYMLVDTYSQYGVGVIYFIAGALDILSYGYGSLLLLTGILTAIGIIVIYATLRIATRSTLFAGAATFAAMLAGPIATIDHVISFPSVGFLRFGIAWLVVVALVVAYRGDRVSRPWLITACGLVGLSSIWSFETAFYTIGTFVCVVAVVACSTAPSGRGRIRAAAMPVAGALAACIIAITILVVATRIGSGVFPRPGAYIDFIRLYSSGDFGTLPVPDWSLGYLICGLYLSSFMAIGVLALHGQRFEASRPSVLVPLAATTALGFFTYTYFLGRSHPNNLTHISPPFVAMVALWTALAARSWNRDRNAIAAAGVLLALWCGALLTTQEWTQFDAKARDSALAGVLSPVTRGESLAARIRYLESNPTLTPQSTLVERLVRRTVPPNAPLLVVIDPAISTELLVRLNRSDVLPIATPVQDGLVPKRRDAIAAEAAHVPCDTRLVTQSTPIPPGEGQNLFFGVMTNLQKHYAFQKVASNAGFDVTILRCNHR